MSKVVLASVATAIVVASGGAVVGKKAMDAQIAAAIAAQPNALQEIAAEVNGIRAARESLEARETTFTTAIDTINTCLLYTSPSPRDS